MNPQNTQVKFIDGTIITVDEFNASKIKGKVLQNPNLHVVLNVEDIEGREYIFPFSAVVFIAPEEATENQAAELTLTEVPDMSLDEMKQYIETVTDIEGLRVMLGHEQAKEKPRKGAIDLLEAKIASL